MDSLKDLWASLVALVYERTANPLTSAFVLSWAGWNYKFFVLLLSDESPSKTFAAIDALYPKPDIFFAGGLLYPLVTSLAYVFIYPFVTERVVKFYRGRQVRIVNVLRAVEETRVRTVEEVSRMVRAHEKALRAADDEATDARAKIEELRLALQNAEGEIAAGRAASSNLLSSNGDPVKGSGNESGTNDDNARLEEKSDKAEQGAQSSPSESVPIGRSNLTQLKLEILTLLTKFPSAVEQLIANELQMERFWVAEELEELKNLGFVTSQSGLNSITKTGRAALRTLIDAGHWSI